MATVDPLKLSLVLLATLKDSTKVPVALPMRKSMVPVLGVMASLNVAIKFMSKSDTANRAPVPGVLADTKLGGVLSTGAAATVVNS